MNESKLAFAIFLDTLVNGAEPAVTDELNRPCLFESRRDAELEIADNLINRLLEFVDGTREFNDAITVEEYIVEVAVYPDGTFRKL